MYKLITDNKDLYGIYFINTGALFEVEKESFMSISEDKKTNEVEVELMSLISDNSVDLSYNAESGSKKPPFRF